jgi:predicted transcriptional regulator
MRTIMLALVVALVGGAGCKESEQEKSARELRKTQEDVEKQREDIREQQKDVVEEQREVQTEIARLDASNDPESKQVAAELRMRRNEVATKLDQIGSRGAADWKSMTSSLDDGLDKLEHDASDAVD